MNIKHKGYQRLFALFLLFMPASIFAQDLDPVTAPEVKRILEDNPDAVLVNALSSLEFAIQHIPGSINIPTNEVQYSDDLPVEKSTELIFYCMGVRCKHSFNASLQAINMGYTRVHWFQGGIPEWRRYDYPMYIDKEMNRINVKKLRVNKVSELIDNKNAFVLDVRPLALDGTQSYIFDSLHIPLLHVQDNLAFIPSDRPIIVVDAFMKQSISAAKFLTKHGYRVAGVLRGGMNKWKKASMPVVGKEDVQVFDPFVGGFVKGSEVTIQ